MVDDKNIIEFFNNLVTKLNEDSNKSDKKYLPKIFYTNDLFLDIAYSSSTKHFLVNFSRSFDRKKSSFTLRDDDVFNHFDKTGIWKEYRIVGGLGFADNKTMICDDLRNSFIAGGKPFHIQGKNQMLILDTFPLNIPVIGSHIIEFAMIISEDRLCFYLENKNDLFNTIREIYFYRKPGIAFQKHIDYLNRVNIELLNLININANELRFDILFQKNPVLLEIALNIKAVEPQIKLPDIHQQYNQDFIPDLLAYDELNNSYVIVDYKRADMKTNKKFRKVGTTFTSTVYDLIHQIHLYREYFNDFSQREEIKKIYGYDVIKPKGIGIIGRINSKEEQIEFNKCIAEYGKDLQLITYSNIYDVVKKYIEKLINLGD